MRYCAQSISVRRQVAQFLATLPCCGAGTKEAPGTGATQCDSQCAMRLLHCQGSLPPRDDIRTSTWRCAVLSPRHGHPDASLYQDIACIHLRRCQWRGPRPLNSNGAASWHAHRSNRSQPSLALQHMFGYEPLIYQDNCKGSLVDCKISSCK